MSHPFTRDPIRPLPPTLTARDVADAQNAFYSSVERELTIRGVMSPAMHTAYMKSIRPYLQVDSTLNGPAVRYSYMREGRVPVAHVADRVIEEAARTAKLAAFGPDPVQQLAARLRTLEPSLTVDEAQEIAAGRVRREDDGRVFALRSDGNVAYEGPQLPAGKELTPEEAIAYHDPAQAVVVATRAILAERAAPARSTPAPDPVSAHVRTVSGAF